MAVPTFAGLPINNDWTATKVVDWAKSINDSESSGFVLLNTFISELVAYITTLEKQVQENDVALTWIEEG